MYQVLEISTVLKFINLLSWRCQFINNYSYYIWKMANCFDSDENENSRSQSLPWIYIQLVDGIPFLFDWKSTQDLHLNTRDCISSVDTVQLHFVASIQETLLQLQPPLHASMAALTHRGLLICKGQLFAKWGEDRGVPAELTMIIDY